jgi:riboflavin synthase
MFTGIVEDLGTVVAVAVHEESARLTISSPVVEGSAPGDSIAVSGVCLTVTEIDHDTFTADVMQETLSRSSLARLTVNDRVNLERAATLATRLGGHVVQGHVDAVGRVTRRDPGDAWEVVTVEVPADLARYIVEKGSIALDGVSLTVASIDDCVLTVSLIPETLRRTTLGVVAAGGPVNVEVDVLAKHVEKLLHARMERT